MGGERTPAASNSSRADTGLPARAGGAGRDSQGIAPPGERLLQKEIEGIMARTSAQGDVPHAGGPAIPEQPVKTDTSGIDTPPPSDTKKKFASLPAQAGQPTPPDIPPESPREPILQKSTAAQVPHAESSRERRESIRTYYGDVAEAVQSRQTSMVDIALAEQRRREGVPADAETAPQEHRGLSVLLLSLGIVFLLAGAGVIGYLYLFTPVRESLRAPAITDTLVPADNEMAFDTTGLTRSELIAALEELRRAASAGDGDITVIRPVRDAVLADNNSVKEAVGSREFLNLFATHIDAPFLRSVEPEYMIGVYHRDLNNGTFFLVLATSFFENAFAGLLRWEPFMSDDLPFLVSHLPSPEPQPTELVATTSTSTAPATTTTEEIIETTPMPEEVGASGGPYVFKDIVVANHTTRALQNRAGDIRMLYAFPRRDLLIITTDPETLKELLNRMSVSRFEG